MSRFILLGVGTAVPDIDRGYTHMVWEGPGGPVLVDAGGDTYQRLLKAEVDPQQLKSIVLTHSHPDHVNGLPSLLFSLYLAGMRDAMPIYGLERTLVDAKRIVDAFEMEKHSVPIDWRPLQGGDELHLETDWVLQTALNNHSVPCLALRFHHTSGRSLAYSGDTAPSQEVVALAKRAYILVHEATVAAPSEGHSTPYQAGEIALQTAVNRLVLVHFSPRWTMPEMEAIHEARRSGFTGTVDIGRENHSYEF